MIFDKAIIKYEDYLQHSKPIENGEWIKSIIVYIFPYYLHTEKANYLPAKFSYGKDYHNIINSFLKEEAKNEGLVKFDTFVDKSPLNEKLCGCLAGLGVKGENDLFISNKFGSFVFIGEIVTDKEFEKTSFSEIKGCLKCGKCVKNCPNKALDNGFDKEKCLSYLSQKVSNNYELYDKMKLYYGCDICQDCCLMNKYILEENNNFEYEDLSVIDLKDIDSKEKYLEISKEKTFSWIGYLKLLRNIIVLKANNNDITNLEIEEYQKKYCQIKWFYDHLEYLKGRIENNGKN